MAVPAFGWSRSQRGHPIQGRPRRCDRTHRIDRKKAWTPYYSHKVPRRAGAGYLAQSMRRFCGVPLVLSQLRPGRPVYGGRRGALAFLVSAACLTGCKVTSVESDAGASEGDSALDAASICDDFTDVGEPCPAAIPVTCFPMCEGGCFCREMPGVGPRWVCMSDTTCLPDCAPVDEPCGQDDGGTRRAAGE